jgi:hypothetical protein
MAERPRKKAAGKPHKGRPSAATAARRAEEVLRIILDGAQWIDICEFVREREAEEGSLWQLPEGGKPLSNSQIRRYVARATAMIAQSCRASRKNLLRRHLAQRRNLYAKAVLQGDVKAALAVLRDEAALLNLYPQPDSELAAQVAELKRMLAEAEARQRGDANRDKGVPRGNGHTAG